MLYLLKKDLKELWYNKKRICVLTMVLIILIVSTYSNVSKKEAKTVPGLTFGVVNEDGSTYSNLLIEYFKNSESFSAFVHVIEGSKSELEQSFSQGNLDLFLVIPSDFAKNMLKMNHIPVQVKINSTDTTKAIVVQNILESYEKYIRAVEVNCASLYNIMLSGGMDLEFVNKKNIEISYDLIFTALGKENFFHYEDIRGFPATSIANYYSLAFISLFLLYSSLYIGFLMIKERKQGTLKRLTITGTPLWKIILEKILLSVGILYLIVVLAYLLPTFHLNNFTDLSNFIRYSSIYLICIIFCVSFIVCLSGLFKKTLHFIIVGNFVCFLFSILGGGIIPIGYLPGTIMELSRLSPIYWMIRLLLQSEKAMGRDTFVGIIMGLLMASSLLYGLSIVIYGREEI